MSKVIFLCIKNPKGVETVTILNDKGDCKSYEIETELETIDSECDQKIVVSFGYSIRRLNELGIVSFFGYNLKDKFRAKYELPETEKMSRWDMCKKCGCEKEMKKYENPSITRNYNGQCTCMVYKLIYDTALKRNN